MASSFKCYGDHRDLHSFPARRSSDLIALSSLPVAGAAVTVGASATGLTVTLRLAVVDAVGPVATSCEIVFTVRAKSTSEFACAWTLRLPRFQPRTLIELWVASAVNV